MISRIIDKEYLPVYLAAFAFILLNSILVAAEIFFLPALPLVLIIVFLAFFSLDKLLILTVFLVPLSIGLSDLAGKEYSLELSLPAEPLLAGITLLFILKSFKSQSLDTRMLRHPVSLAVYFHLAWILITSLTSTMPLVSFKFLVSRIWFVIPFYMLAVLIFQDKGKIRLYLGAYILPLMMVMGYVFVRHSMYGFTNQQAAHFVVKPFFNDHTSYGAVLAMILPVLLGYYQTISRKCSPWLKILFFIIISFFITAIIFSYTRAAWVSLLTAVFVWAIIKLRISWPIILSLSLVLFFAIFSYRAEIVMKLEKNKQTSSGNFSEHIQSIVNISHDESNLERFNRWNSALKMFKEKPVFGWGPGTYMFQYAPFQVSGEKTSISTNAGTAGNAHSEYLGPLAESGIPGVVGMLIIMLLTIRTGLRVYFTAEKRKIKIMSLAILLGLITYYTHGILNNFLDTDKASALFWGFTAMLVAMDIYHKEKKGDIKA